jgi:acetyl-CoA carboxylase carboxyltransferase component
VVSVTPDTVVAVGETLCVIESMKLEHPVTATAAGSVHRLLVARGDIVTEGDVLMEVTRTDVEPDRTPNQAAPLSEGSVRLDELAARRVLLSDAARPDAVERVHASGRSTAREKIEALTDEGSFREYGSFVIAAQRARREIDDLIRNTPADGLVCGVGTINGGELDGPDTHVTVLAYDYSVLAGTQGAQNHRKTDRLLDIARNRSLPLVLFADGGGGRPGDTETTGRSGLDVPTFAKFARLSGKVPLIAVVSGYCFAGNAILAGMCDVIIATSEAHIGAGGPAMIEGGGLGIVERDEIGPVSTQSPNGVIDVVVQDDAEAVATAKKYLSFFQGAVENWTTPDQRQLQSAIPDNHRRVYDVRCIVSTIADDHSVLELREASGRSIVTALARVEGHPVGIIASDPGHGGGAIDTDASDKGARFIQLCDAFGIPVVSLVDTPGIMVGPDAEAKATVRHASRLFVAGANAKVPVMAVITRRGYGLGAMAMVGGGFKETVFTVAWPTATMGPMGLEGAVTLGYRKELDAIEDPSDREARYEVVASAYDDGRALNAATWFDVDEVIDPADTREWIATFLRDRPVTREWGRTAFVDPW